jgi:hypothetical protein
MLSGMENRSCRTDLPGYLAQHVRKLSEDTREICRGARRGATALQAPADAEVGGAHSSDEAE